MDIADLAWTAGIVDGETSISIAKRTRKKKISVFPEYQLQICCESKTKVMQDNLQKLWGGSVTPYKDKRENRADTWKWSIAANQAIQFLELVLPYLIVKSKQAELAIEFQSRVVERKETHHFLTWRECAIRDKIYGEMKYLNRRGK